MVKTRTRIHILAAALTIVALAAALGGCGRAPAGPTTEFVPFSAEERQLRDAAKDARYRLRPGDELYVDLKFTDRLDLPKVKVLPDGRLAASGLDEVRVSGLTLAELDSLLTVCYARDFRHPDLNVGLLTLGPSSFYVLGQVNKPGAFTMPETGAGVLQAVAMAGGFAEFAKPSETVLIRIAPEGYQYVRVNLDDLDKPGDIAAAASLLRPHDVIYVPKSRIGDIAFFTKNVLGGVLNLTDLFWDIYAIANIDKVDRLVR